MSKLRICAPLALIALASSDGQKFTATRLVKSASNRGIVPGVDIGFEKHDENSVEVTVQDASVLKNLQGLMTTDFDQPSHNPRFFQQSEDGRFKATVTHDLLKEVGTPSTVPTKDRWRHAVNELAQLAHVSMMPPALPSAKSGHAANQRA